MTNSFSINNPLPIPPLHNIFPQHTIEEHTRHVSPESLFIETDPHERFLKFLQEAEITEKNGLLKKGKGLMPMPAPSMSMQVALHEFLNAPHLLRLRHENFHFWLFPLLATIPYDPSIEFVGGFVRQIIARNPHYIAEALAALTGLSAERLKEWLSPELLSDAYRQLPDYDIRVLCPGANKEDLEQKIQGIKTIFQYITQKTAAELSSLRAFPKCRVIDEKDIRYGIIAFGQIELLFWSQAKRNCLFTADALRLALLTPKSHPRLSLATAFGNGWQSLIDLLAKIIRIPDPHSVDKTGFPKMISYFTRSFVLADQEALPILCSTTLDLRNQSPRQTTQYYDSATLLADLLSADCNSHLDNHPDAGAAMACNASYYLIDRLEAKGIQRIWQRLTVIPPHSPLLCLLVKAVEENSALETLLSTLVLGSFLGVMTRPAKNGYTIRHHAGAPAIQVLCAPTEFTLLVPLKLENALALLEKNEISERLLSIIEHMIFSHAQNQTPLTRGILDALKLDKSALKSRVLSLLTNDQWSVRYLGFLLLTALLLHSSEKTELFPLFYKHLPFMLEKRSGRLRDFLTRIFHQTQDKATAALIENLTPDLQGDLSLIRKLSEKQEIPLLKQAALQWKHRRGLIPLNERGRHDLLVAFSFLPLGLDAALFLFKQYLSEQDKTILSDEIPLLKKLLNRASYLENPKLSTILPTLNPLTTLIFSRHGKNALAELAVPLQNYIKRLMQAQLLEPAFELLESALPQLIQLKQTWLEWLKIAVQHPELARTLTEKIKVLANAPTPHQETIYWNALETLLYTESTEQLALQALKHIKRTQGLEEKIRQIAQAKICSLLEHLPQEKTAPSFVKTYKVLLTPPLLQKALEFFLSRHLEQKEYKSALTVWNPLCGMEMTGTLQKLTIELLEALSVSELEQALRKLENLPLLSPEANAGYQLRLFDMHKSPSTFDFLLETISGKHAQLLPQTLLQIADRMLTATHLFKTTKNLLLESAVTVLIPLLAQKCLFAEAEKLIAGTPSVNAEVLRNFYRKALNERGATEMLFDRLDKLQAIEEASPFLDLLLSLPEKLPNPLKAKFYLRYAAHLHAAPLNGIREDVLAIVFKKRINEKISLKLLKQYPPCSAKDWDILFQNKKAAQILTLWEQFKDWLAVNASKSNAKCLTALAATMKGITECAPWFYNMLELLLKRDPLFDKIFKDAPEPYENFCLTVIEESFSMIKEERQILSLFFIFSLKKSSVNNKIKWLDLLVKQGSEDCLREASKLLTQTLSQATVKNQRESISVLIEKLIQADWLPTELIPLMKKNLSAAQLVNIAEHMLKKTPENAPLVMYLLEVLYTSPDESNNEHLYNIIGKCLLQLYQGDIDTSQSQMHIGFIRSHINTFKQFSIRNEISYNCLGQAFDYLNSLLYSSSKPEMNTLEQFEMLTQELLLAFVGPRIETNLTYDEHTLHRLVFDYPAKDPQKPMSTQGEILFFNTMVLFLKKLMIGPSDNRWFQKIAHPFICSNLNLLIKRYPQRTTQFLDLLDSLIYSIPPRLTQGFEEQHQRIQQLLISNIHHFGLTGKFSDYLIYANIKIDGVRSPRYGKVHNVLKRVLSDSTAEGFFYAMRIIKTNRSTLSPEELYESYQLFFDQLLTSPPSFSQLIHLSLFEEGPDCINDPGFATKISSKFIDTLWKLYRIPNKAHILSIVAEILTKTVKKNGFRSPEFKEKLLEHVKELIDKAQEEDPKAIEELMINLFEALKDFPCEHLKKDWESFVSQ